MDTEVLYCFYMSCELYQCSTKFHFLSILFLTEFMRVTAEVDDNGEKWMNVDSYHSSILASGLVCTNLQGEYKHVYDMIIIIMAQWRTT